LAGVARRLIINPFLFAQPRTFQTSGKIMPKYLLKASYTAAGAKALAGDSATGRKAAIARAAKSLGGKLESFYYALGETDVFLIMDLPDNGAAARLALTVGSTGVATIATIPLLTVEELDKALRRKVAYRPPGQK
jgi:uncharacterized protein with GYD domain